MACGLALLASGQAFATVITSNTTGSWNDSAIWTPNQVPTNADDVTIAATHTVTVNANAVASKLIVNNGGTLNFAVNATPFTLTAGIGGIQNQGAFNATNAGAITSSTANTTQGLYNYGAATFTMGTGTLTLSATSALGFENDGTFTGGSGLISVGSFRNGDGAGTRSLTVGTGGLSVTTGTYYPSNGTVVLNGNLTIGENIATGAVTYSGAGKMILTDAIHTITGPVNVHNLETAAFTGAHTLTLSGTVTATGTTKLNGSSSTNTISFSGASTPTFTAFNSYYCSAAGGVTGITCNAGAPPLPTPAPIDLHFSTQPETFATEIDLK